MKLSEYDAYKASHPELERYIDVPPVVTFEGRTFSPPNERVKGGFKEVLEKIAENNPYTALGDTHRKNKTVKQIKTRDIIRDYSKKKVKRAQDARK